MKYDDLIDLVVDKSFELFHKYGLTSNDIRDVIGQIEKDISYRNKHGRRRI